METRRLELLVALARLGSMREVADEMGVTTSTVSQQIAALARETGTTLLEPVGRRVRLTPAGRRLADHGLGILAAVDAARADLNPDAEPVGTVRVAGFATAIEGARIVIEVRDDLFGGGLPSAVPCAVEPRQRLEDVVVLGVSKVDRVLEAGATNLAVSEAVSHEGFFYAPGPSSQLV